MTVSTDAAGLDLGQFLRPGDRIVWGQACGEPTTLVEALIAQGQTSADSRPSRHQLLRAPRRRSGRQLLPFPAWARSARCARWPQADRLGIMPCHVSQVGPMIEQGLIGCDVAFVQVSPPDADGNHSFGLISDYVQAAVAKARVVIAEVNERCRSPRRCCCRPRASTAPCMSRARR